MKMTLREVNEHYVGLKGIEGLTLPGKLTFAVAKNIAKLETEVRAYEKSAQKLREQYAEKDTDGTPVTVKKIQNGNEMEEYKMLPKNKAAFAKELNDLLEEETEIEIHMAGNDLVEMCEKEDKYSTLNVRSYCAMDFMIN